MMRRMGIRVDYPAITLLYNQYNGHPMLLRLACSYINRQYSLQNRPITIKIEDVKNYQEEIDVELAYYFKHVVSEIQQFYPDEYESSGMRTQREFLIRMNRGLQSSKRPSKIS